VGQRVCLFGCRVKFFTTATIAILLMVEAAVASIERAPQISGNGSAINCSGSSSEAINSYCNANKEFEEFDSNTDRPVLSFVKTRILNSDLHEGIPVSNRFYDVYQSASYPIYLVYFSSHIYLDLTFERLTEYIEEKNERLSNYTFKSTNEGHDFVIADIARFYTYMNSRGLPLNALEAHLKRALMDGKILIQNSKGLHEGEYSGAVILALSQESQRGVLSHELNHGVYFSDPTYRQFVQTCWMDLSSDDKNLVQKVLSNITDGNLDIERNSSLFLREFAAYFRDSETLLREYLDDDEKKSNLNRLLAIESKLRNIEKHIQFYQNHSP
jgi:hypothetical protein